MEPIDEFMDRRRFRRISAESTARVNFDGFWHNCPVVDLSGGGGSFRSWLQPAEGSNVLVQIRGVGVVRAKVVRRWDQGFAVEFDAEDYDADTLVDNLTLSANPGVLGPPSGESRSGARRDKPSAIVAKPSTPPDAPAAEQTQADSPQDRKTDEGTRRHPLNAIRKALG